jgi:hypothetical protein
MKGVDRKELNNGTIVSYALVMAIFHALDDETKTRVKKSVLSYMPPAPDPANGQPVDEIMWRDAHRELKALAGQ